MPDITGAATAGRCITGIGKPPPPASLFLSRLPSQDLFPLRPPGPIDHAWAVGNNLSCDPGRLASNASAWLWIKEGVVGRGRV